MSMEIVCIKFNAHVWEMVLPVLKIFYMQYMLPCILYYCTFVSYNYLRKLNFVIKVFVN